MLGSKMGVAHDHLKRSVPEKVCDSAQIYPGHHESTGKSMAVAMKDISLSSHHEQAYSSRRLDEINGPLLAGGRSVRYVPRHRLRRAARDVKSQYVVVRSIENWEAGFARQSCLRRSNPRGPR
jgi:hypothetical protein